MVEHLLSAMLGEGNSYKKSSALAASSSRTPQKTVSVQHVHLLQCICKSHTRVCPWQPSDPEFVRNTGVTSSESHFLLQFGHTLGWIPWETPPPGTSGGGDPLIWGVMAFVLPQPIRRVLWWVTHKSIWWDAQEWKMVIHHKPTHFNRDRLSNPCRCLKSWYSLSAVGSTFVPLAMPKVGTLAGLSILLTRFSGSVFGIIRKTAPKFEAVRRAFLAENHSGEDDCPSVTCSNNLAASGENSSFVKNASFLSCAAPSTISWAFLSRQSICCRSLLSRRRFLSSSSSFSSCFLPVLSGPTSNLTPPFWKHKLQSLPVSSSHWHMWWYCWAHTWQRRRTTPSKCFPQGHPDAGFSGSLDMEGGVVRSSLTCCDWSPLWWGSNFCCSELACCSRHSACRFFCNCNRCCRSILACRWCSVVMTWSSWWFMFNFSRACRCERISSAEVSCFFLLGSYLTSLKSTPSPYQHFLSRQLFSFWKLAHQISHQLSLEGLLTCEAGSKFEACRCRTLSL